MSPIASTTTKEKNARAHGDLRRAIFEFSNFSNSTFQCEKLHHAVVRRVLRMPSLLTISTLSSSYTSISVLKKDVEAKDVHQTLTSCMFRWCTSVLTRKAFNRRWYKFSPFFPLCLSSLFPFVFPFSLFSSLPLSSS